MASSGSIGLRNFGRFWFLAQMFGISVVGAPDSGNRVA